MINCTIDNYIAWSNTEDKAIAAGCTEEDNLLYLESMFNDIMEAVEFNTNLLSGNDIDVNSSLGVRAVRAMDYVAACIDKAEEFQSKGRILETRFYDACKKQFGCTNVVKASLQDDVLAGTDYFVYGFRIDTTFYDKTEYAIAKNIYYCENNGLQCTASIINRNKHSMYLAPVLSLRFSGNTEGFQPLYHLIKEHMTPMLLEFNKMCHVLNLSF